jgi:predicted Ser/Thr protein kinase
MADWAENECNNEFSKEEINECYTNFANDEVSDAQLADCAEYKDRIDEEWTCEDISVYFP